MNEQGDAIAALAHTLDNLDRHIQVVDRTAKRSEINRLSMLHVHAAAAVLIGPTFAGIGKSGMAGQIWTVVRLIPGAPYTLGAVIFAGGVILGTATWLRAVWWEMVGLWVLLLWYATIAWSFGAAVWLWLLSDTPPGAPHPSFYAPILYSHLAAIMGVHLRTLRRIRRTARRHARW